MRWMRWLLRRLRVLTRNRDVERDMDDEISFHVAMETQENTRRGMNAAEARRAALVAFGGIERTKERARDARGGRLPHDILTDLRLAWRSLLRAPVFVTTAAGTLAIGTGSLTALFALVSGVLLTPLPFRDPGRLELIGMRHPESGGGLFPVSPLDFADLRDRAEPYAGLAIYTSSTQAILDDGEPDHLQIRATQVSGDYFELLGQQPRLGRLFGTADGVRGAPSAVVLSPDFWVERYGADPTVVGRSIRLEDVPATIVGVAAPGATLIQDTDVWSNYTLGFGIGARAARWLNVVGRLGPGVEAREAHAHLEGVARQLADEHPTSNEGWDVAFQPLTEAVFGPVRRTLWFLLGSTVFVLLLACGNVGGLLLARRDARAAEFAMRTALGARRAHLVRQLVSEAAVLAGVAVVPTGLLAVGIVELTRAFGPADIPRLDSLSMDLRSLGVMALATGFAAAVLGVLSSLRWLRAGGGPDLAGHIRSAGASRQLSRVLLGAQVAFSTVVLIGAGLLTRSFVNLSRQDTGVASRGVVGLELSLPGNRYGTLDDVVGFYTHLLADLDGQPGLRGVSVTSSLPLGVQYDHRLPYSVIGRPRSDRLEELQALYRKVGPGFFETLGVPLIRGRTLTPQDRRNAPGVVIVNETFVHRTWPDGENPIGKHLSIVAGNFGPRSAILVDEAEVVGVVGDVRYVSPAADPEPSIYLGYEQAPFAHMFLVAQADADPSSTIGSLRARIRAVDPDFAVSSAVPLEELHARAVARPRFTAWLIGAFAVSALALVAVGVFGVVAGVVQSRRAEMAVRTALGASRPRVVGTVVRETVHAVLLGALVGGLSAVVASRVIQGLLYGLSPTDPLTLAVVAALILATGATAALVPAWRAVRLDPVSALRAD